MARRWVDAFPPTEKGEVVEERKPEARELLLGNPTRLIRARSTLGSLSAFMKWIGRRGLQLRETPLPA